MDYLIMRERKNISFIISIENGEGDFAGHISPVVRMCPEIFQSIMHPSQIPLIIESQPAFFHLPCYAGISCGILGNQHRRGMEPVQPLVHDLQKVDSSTVFTPLFISLPVDQPADSVHS